MPPGAINEPAPAALKVEAESENDLELLRAYVEERSEESFSKLVARHIDWVYSAALRQTRNHATAQDIAQAVFIILARKAASIKEGTVLAGWLFRAIRYAVRDAVKIEARRQRREQEAVTMEAIQQGNNDTEARWQELAPLLDQALEKLPSRDRNAILLRFFERKEWREVGASLGLDDNAARVRTGRAIDKLRAIFERHGVTLSAVALSTALLSQAAHAAPASLAAGPAGGTATVSAIVNAVLKRWFWWRTAALASLLALVLCGVWAGLAYREAARQDDIRAAVRRIDMAYTLHQPEFANMVHFRDANDLRFLPVLTNYARAVHEFRIAFREVLQSEIRPWYAAFHLLVAGQNSTLTNDPSRRHAFSPEGFGRHPMCLVLTNGTWRWDFFHGQTAKAVEQRMQTLEKHAQAVDEIARRVKTGEFRSAEEALSTMDQLTKGKPLPDR